ncbi:hypothetical protein K432DRAFT_448358 [Lepidopterella palustris CBS 459.81]|uniref:Uncharacterized protein n=1 Tax=Lepidopterella palustris CBS 459.81 TaxID=1314670 RepID=A0A8E2ELI9_9PEZI|nr:hypothetical protein K432DRAFT_448358 [Lepidopterella palustris CBS 459.81]
MILSTLIFLRKRPNAAIQSKPSHGRSEHQFYASKEALKPTEDPRKQVLPCGCTCSHVPLSQLPSITRESHRPTTSFSAFSSTPESLKRVDGFFQFNYYLPHISDHVMDFYTDRAFVAYDVDDDEWEPERAKQLALPEICDWDSQYYPGCEGNSSRSSDDSDERLRPGTPSMDATATYQVQRIKRGIWFSRFLKSLRRLVRRSDFVLFFNVIDTTTSTHMASQHDCEYLLPLSDAPSASRRQVSAYEDWDEKDDVAFMAAHYPEDRYKGGTVEDEDLTDDDSIDDSGLTDGEDGRPESSPPSSVSASQVIAPDRARDLDSCSLISRCSAQYFDPGSSGIPEEESTAPKRKYQQDKEKDIISHSLFSNDANRYLQLRSGCLPGEEYAVLKRKYEQKKEKERMIKIGQELMKKVSPRPARTPAPRPGRSPAPRLERSLAPRRKRGPAPRLERSPALAVRTQDTSIQAKYAEVRAEGRLERQRNRHLIKSIHRHATNRLSTVRQTEQKVPERASQEHVASRSGPRATGRGWLNRTSDWIDDTPIPSLSTRVDISQRALSAFNQRWYEDDMDHEPDTYLADMIELPFAPWRWHAQHLALAGGTHEVGKMLEFVENYQRIYGPGSSVRVPKYIEVGGIPVRAFEGLVRSVKVEGKAESDTLDRPRLGNIEPETEDFLEDETEDEAEFESEYGDKKALLKRVSGFLPGPVSLSRWSVDSSLVKRERYIMRQVRVFRQRLKKLTVVVRGGKR